ncbi:MAG: AAA family ATPase [Candidatus Omnitrophota bacterium]|nr:AAA family ATPase [Candidatus Omnitrophota bacterium]
MSYYEVLGIQKEPFSSSPDPAFFYHSPEHNTVLHRLEIAIRLRRGLSLILGDVGTGKTTLSRTLFQAFNGEEDKFVFHMILDPHYKSEYQFLSSLVNIFKITPDFRSTIDHREAIEKYLFQKGVDEDKTIVLLIDEGQKLSQPILEILRTLLNYETNEYKLLQLIIMAQMELLPRVKKIRNFMDRVSLKYIINPLDENETAELINFRLRQAGYQKADGLFVPEAIKKIYEFSQGYPRKISQICHNCLERIVMEGKDIIDASIVDNLLLEEEKWV